MWPYSSYPERRPEDVEGRTYDYIVVGGGCAGCVLASRLSEDPAVSVLVLEKGLVKDSWYTRIPLLSQNYDFPWMQAVSRLSEPIRELGGRRMKFWTAEAVGGATRINAMLLTRGVPGGFNEWARSFGLVDWGWDQVEPFFRKSENAVGHPDAPHRGHSGPMENRQPPPWLSTVQYYEKAAEAVGLPVERDLNDPRASAQGCFRLDQTIDARSERLSAYRAWLNADIAKERKSRLTVCTGVLASRLEVDAKTKQVTGVHVRYAKRTSDDKDYFVRVRREVIVCSGTMCTPQLLMLSGIGPRDQIEPHGIPLVHDLPAVGRNLTDHYSVPIMHELPYKDTLSQIETLWGILFHFFLYLFFGKGLLAASSTPASIFVRSSAIDDDTMTVKTATDEGSTMDASEPRNVPDIELMLTPIRTLTGIGLGKSLSSIYTTLIQPFARGRVELASTDPREHPRIHYEALSDERDVAVCRKATRFAIHVAEQFTKTGYSHPAPLTFAPSMDLDYLDSLYAKRDRTLKPQAAGNLPDHKPAPDVPGVGESKHSSSSEDAALEKQQAKVAKTDWRSVTDEEIDAYAKRVCVTSLHFSSTCRMSLGPEDGVVDQRLRVHGMRNLRIADASVFPKIPSAHTMAPTVMVAERCADFLKREWEERKEK